jgi:hypothetical protein
MLIVRLLTSLAGLFLSWIVVQNGLGLALGSTDPELARRLDPRGALAASTLSDRSMLVPPQTLDRKAVVSFSHAAVIRAPLDAVAIRNLGFVADLDGRAEAERLLRLSGRVSLRDYLTHAWLLNRNLDEGRYDDAAHELDILMRTENWRAAMPQVIYSFPDRRFRAAIVRLLARKPYWRGDFLLAIGLDDGGDDDSYALLQALRLTAAPPTTSELQPFFNAMTSKLPGAELYRRWITLLPGGPLKPGDALLRDGSFEGLDAPMPYNWRMTPGSGTYSEISANPAGAGHVLYASFEGDAATQFTKQALRLPPGNYRLSGLARAQNDVPRGAFVWSLACTSKDAPPGEGTQIPLAPVTDRWTKFTATFTISAACPEQQISLNGAPEEGINPLSIWVDGLSIAPTH